MNTEYPDLAKYLGHGFANPDLLTQALTHPSAFQGRGRHKAMPYERLEFLGDRVLGLVVADMLFQRFPSEPEGALARRHAALVRRETLARVAEQIGLPPKVIMSKGEEDAGGRANPALLADACEAVIGAMFADAGFAVAQHFVSHLWAPLMEESAQPPKDAKTALQEWAQGLGKNLPTYRTVGTEGPPHDPVFRMSVEVEGEEPVYATGPSKRIAEQAAAAAMLKKVSK